MIGQNVSHAYLRVVVPQELSADLVDPATPEIVRPAPGIRGITAAEVGGAIIVGLSAGANVASLICAKDALYEVANRLLRGMRRSRLTTVTLSIRKDGHDTSLSIRTTDESLHVAKCLQSLVSQLEEYEEES